MTKKLTKKQTLILDFISEFTKSNDFSPSYREIMRGVGLSSVSAVVCPRLAASRSAPAAVFLKTNAPRLDKRRLDLSRTLGKRRRRRASRSFAAPRSEREAFAFG